MNSTFLRSFHLVSLLNLLIPFILCAQPVVAPQERDAFPALLQRISLPTFPKKDFDVTRFGAVGDGKTDCSEAFKKAINKCNTEGGGRVVVPKGIYLTGAIHLKSNVNLYVPKEATIKFNTDPKLYLPVVFVRWEGVECFSRHDLDLLILSFPPFFC